jgi:membrane protease YdiL (CAAX protease family)
MYDNDSKGISFTAGVFMLIAFTVAGVILASIIYYPIWTAMTGRPITEMEKDLSNPAFGDAAKVFQTITAIFGFFLPAFVTAAILNRKPLKLLGYSHKIKISLFGWVVLIMFASVIVSSSLSYFNNIIPLPENWKTMFTKWENSYNDQVTAIIGLNNIGEYILALAIMAFLPALCEETLFRGGLQNFLTRSIKIPLLSIIITSIIFSAIHLSWYGFLSRFFLGFILGYIYHYSGKIWLNIFAHFLNNALAITALFIYKMQGKPVKDLIADNGSWWGIIALPAVIALLLFFKRMMHGSALLTKRSNT